MSTFFRGWLAAGLVTGLTLGASAQDKKPDKLDTAQQADIKALVELTDEAATGKAAAPGLPVKWEQNHFIKSQEDKTYVPFTVAIEPGGITGPTPVGVYLRVTKRGELPQAGPAEPVAQDPKKKKDDKDKNGSMQSDSRHQYAFEDAYFFDVSPAPAGQPVRIRRAFAVRPGDYDVYVAVKEAAAAGATTTPKSGVAKQELTVPSLDGSELTTSSVIVAEKVDVLQTGVPTERQAENPYTFGAMKIVPSQTNKFAKKDDLNVIFWIYGASPDPATKKPNVTVDYTFNQKTGDAEKYFNKTEPQVMNAETLPPQFDLAAGHQLPGSLAVPLASFPEGDYHLAVKVTDKVSGKTVARDVTFSVAAQ